MSEHNYIYDNKVHFQEYPELTYRPLKLEELLARQARVARYVIAEHKDSIVVLSQDNHTAKKKFIPKEVRKIATDGNCFFRSISFALYRTEQNHSKLRNFLANYICEKLKNDSPVLCFLDKVRSPKEYVQESRIGLDKIWATQFEIAVMAMALDLNIAVYKEQFDDNAGLMKARWNLFTHTGEISRANYTLPQILLFNQGGNHFEYVVTVQPAAQLQTPLNLTIDISDSSVVPSPHPLCSKSSEKKKKVLKKRRRRRPKSLGNKSILEILDNDR